MCRFTASCIENLKTKRKNKKKQHHLFEWKEKKRKNRMNVQVFFCVRNYKIAPIKSALFLLDFFFLPIYLYGIIIIIT